MDSKLARAFEIEAMQKNAKSLEALVPRIEAIEVALASLVDIQASLQAIQAMLATDNTPAKPSRRGS